MGKKVAPAVGMALDMIAVLKPKTAVLKPKTAALKPNMRCRECRREKQPGLVIPRPNREASDLA